MDDKQIVDRINELAAEEQRLEEAHVGEGLTDEERARMHEVEVTLGPALGHAAPAAGQARRRPGPRRRRTSARPDTVEGYLQ